MRGSGEGSIYKRSDGYWIGTIELPPIAGKRQRRTVSAKDKNVLLDKLDAERIKVRDAGGTIPTREITLGEWLIYWLAHIDVRPNTLAGYRSVISNHIIPTLGSKRIGALTADDIRRLEVDIRGKDRVSGKPERGKLSATYANNAHTILSIALKAALAERVLFGSNIAALMKSPKKSRPKLQALEIEESIQVLRSLVADPYASLWSAFFFTGARRGEIIGLERDRVSDVLDLSWQMQRLIWSHGCGGECGKARGTDCPSRTLDVPDDYEFRHIDGGLYWTRPKSSAGWRIVPLVEPLKSILEQYLAATPPNRYGLVWTQPHGWPLDPDQVTKAWAREVLPGAGIEKAVSVHDIRHSTIDLLYDLDIPEDVIMEIVGHSVASVTRGYKSRTSKKRLSEALLQLGELFATGT